MSDHPQRGRPKTVVQNPWGLTHGEVDTMDELCRLGNSQAVANRLGISYDSVRSALSRAGKKMGIAGQLLMAIKWDRWRQGEGKGVPA